MFDIKETHSLEKRVAIVRLITLTFPLLSSSAPPCFVEVVSIDGNLTVLSSF